jgi:NAD(P)-dependent dehydrogenase (short-subunit alcohol dehydrogenase family)
MSSYGTVVYAMTKHGVIGLTRCLSAQLARYRIRVNAVCPGTAATPMVMNDHVLSLFSGVETGGTVEAADLALRGMALLPDAWVEPRDVANAVCFLASDEARSITGIAMPVDLGAKNQPPGIPPVATAMLAAAQLER